MYTFQINIHARANDVANGAAIQIAGQSWPTLSVPASAWSVPLGVSFTSASDALAKLERMFIEPDGAFVWVSSREATPWQVDGVLYDRDERLMFVDLKGTCPADEFDRLLTCFGWPQTSVMLQLVREAVFLDEDDFRRFASQ